MIWLIERYAIISDVKAQSYAAPAADKPLEYYEFERREPTSEDVELEVLFCGICHSDIHTARGDWGEVAYQDMRLWESLLVSVALLPSSSLVIESA